MSGSGYRRGWQEGWAHGWHAGRASLGREPASLRAATINDLPHGLDRDDDGLVVYVSREGSDYRWCGVGLHWHPAGSCPPCMDIDTPTTQPQRDQVERLLGEPLQDWQWELLTQWSIPGAPNPRPEQAGQRTGAPSCAGTGESGR